MRLEARNGAADRGGRMAEAPAGAGEAAGIERGDEHPHRFEPIHRSFRILQE
jgi:hypothetical protein